MTPPEASGQPAAEDPERDDSASDSGVSGAGGSSTSDSGPESEEAVAAAPLGGLSLGDFIALEPSPQPAPAAKASTAAAAGGDKGPAAAAAAPAAEPGVVMADSADGQLPWERASTRIRSPLLRLHNGAGVRSLAAALSIAGWSDRAPCNPFRMPSRCLAACSAASHAVWQMLQAALHDGSGDTYTAGRDGSAPRPPTGLLPPLKSLK